MTITEFLTKISILHFNKETLFVSVRQERKCPVLFRLTPCFKFVLAFASYSTVTADWLAPNAQGSFLPQLVKRSPTIYETRKFINAFTSARHLSLSQARSVQSIPPHIQSSHDIHSPLLCQIHPLYISRSSRR